MCRWLHWVTVLLLTKNKFDEVCLSKNYLDSSVSPKDRNLEIPRHNLISTDYCSNQKLGSVCIYASFKGVFMKLSFKIRVGDQLSYFVSLYRSPYQIVNPKIYF